MSRRALRAESIVLVGGRPAPLMRALRPREPRHTKGITLLDIETLPTVMTRKIAISAGARKGVTISFRSERAENEMRDVNDRTYTPLVEIGAADVDFICAPSRISILAAAALEGLRRYSDEYEFGCLTGGQPRSRTPKFG